MERRAVCGGIAARSEVQGIQSARPAAAARRLQDRREKRRDLSQTAPLLRKHDRPKRHRQSLRPSSAPGIPRRLTAALADGNKRGAFADSAMHNKKVLLRGWAFLI